MWKLWKTLYGTMQGGHDWFKTLSHTYQDLGYKQSRAEPTIRTQQDGEKFTITCTYTDDTMGRSLDEKEAEKAKKELEEQYDVKTMKEVNHMLGIKVEKVGEDIWISQTAYANQMLEKFGMINYKPRSILLPVGIPLSSNDRPDTEEEMKGILY